MTNYKELIDTLRDLTHGIVRISNGSVLREAANAIETLTAELAEERHRHDRLHEWAKAEQEGRLVVLPCKVGDTVYKINHGDYAHHWKPFVQEGTVTEISCKNNRSGKALGFAIIVRLNYEARVRFKFSNIGKTVFLTREEAEAALTRERKDGEG